MRPRADFTNDEAYDFYVHNQRQEPPRVEQEGRRWKVSWGPEDVLWYTPGPYMLMLCRLVAHECMAGDIFFETGATPNGRPWTQQPWWRLELWLAHQSGLSAKHKPKKDEDDVGRGE